MRIHKLNGALRGAHDERGAAAILLALLAVVLIGMAAFAVDLGFAYSTKRQLSVAADAAALAAARQVNAALPVGTACNSTVLQPIAQSAAVLANSQNDRVGGSTVTSVSVDCSNDDVQVTVTNEKVVDAIFGPVLGVSNYRPSRSATAQLFVPQAAYGLRPIAACYQTVIDNYKPSATPPVINPFVVWVSKDSAVCGTATAGQWGFTNFLEQGGFGEYDQSGTPAYNPDPQCNAGNTSAGANAGCQTEWTADGYGGPVWFPNNAIGGDTGLGGNTGLANSSDWRNAFDGLVDEVIQLPVADRYSEQSGIDRFNVLGVVSVRVCSANRGGTVVQGTSAECAASRVPTATQVPDWYTLNNNEGGLWVIPVDFATSGVAGPRTGCMATPPPAGCDLGTRAIALYR